MSGFATDFDLTTEGAAPEWVHLIPPGHFTARDGRVFDNTDPGVIIEAFGHNGADLPVDYQHQNDRPEATRNGPVPAAGWIKELAARADGIWGRVEWTERARDMIARREHRYLSPVLKCHKIDRRILMLKGAGLVHSPALHLTELAEEEDMSDTPFASRVAEVLSLAPDASEADIPALLARVRAAMAQTVGITELAQMDAPPVSQPRTAGHVSIETLQAVLSERNEAFEQMRASHVKARVDDAFAHGYLSPALREWATDLCASNAAAFDRFVEKSIPHFKHIVTPQPSRASAPPWAARSEPETFPEVETAICEQLGLKPGALSS